MRNPLVFWGSLALLQFLWLFVGWGFYRYVQLFKPQCKHAWVFMLAAVVIGDVLMWVFNAAMPTLRWRGTMGLLLFTSYAVMFVVAAIAWYSIGKRFMSAKILHTSLLIAMPLSWMAVIAAGLYGAYSPTTVHYQVKLDKPMSEPIKVALVADTHLGKFIGKHHLQALNEILQREQADILLLAGDVMDDLPDDYRTLNMHPYMQQLSAPLGKYVVLGNHDNYRQVQADIVQDLQDAGFTVLRDERVQIGEQLVLIGRRDKVEPRLPAAQLLPQSDMPVVVIDHQPVPEQMQALAHAGADLTVSGHTHGGQIFPMTALIGFFQTYPYGHYHIDNNQLIVTSGLGLWGLPFRLGTRSEVVIIHITGK
ncbi:metallophosphoesterase [Vitreoscilla sp. C1]|uniref:metallophosphoesterase n=1 Tax=Vitreoscilla sp. (strain C1) TaxID=96942 RepID=UPI00148EDDA6|nr:metallophosphoesterase [Vitreoscilla sp. C1]